MAQFQITFRGMTPSDALRAVAEEKFDKLSQKFGRSASCSIVIDHATGKQHGKRAFSARVRLHAGGVPEVYAAAVHESASAAVREAFERASSQAPGPRTKAPSSVGARTLVLLR